MRKILSLFLILLSFSSFGQSNTFQLSSHILDISTGTPASSVKVSLHKLNSGNAWVPIATKYTDNNGRINDFLPYKKSSNSGVYKLTFETLDYFRKNKIESFYPFIDVIFTIEDQVHYHVPISISPYGYSTYKGN